MILGDLPEESTFASKPRASGDDPYIPIQNRNVNG